MIRNGMKIQKKHAVIRRKDQIDKESRERMIFLRDKHFRFKGVTEQYLKDVDRIGTMMRTIKKLKATIVALAIVKKTFNDTATLK
jgi:hypothetical protein